MLEAVRQLQLRVLAGDVRMEGFDVKAALDALLAFIGQNYLCF